MNSPLPIPLHDQVSALVGKHLLVVDDDEAMLTAVCKVLNHAGALAPPALLASHDTTFDAVLTDLRMPDASGKTILSAIKSASPAVPVLMMSAFWTEEIKQECAEQGASSLLDKPLNTRSLLAAVAKALLGSQP